MTKGDFGEIKEGYSMIGSDFVEMKELEKVTIGPGGNTDRTGSF